MDGTTMTALAAASFVGTHFAMSHPLRRPLVARIGENGFLALYSLVSAVTLGWTGYAYWTAEPTPPLWDVGEGMWGAVTLLMLVASVLLVGSLIGNPALPGTPGTAATTAQARGVFAVTRHPMLWAFALWGACHIAVYPVAANIAVALAIIVLALVGAALQDRKKEALQGEAWRAWEDRTSYWPFAAIMAGRARFGGFRPHDIAGGVVVWLAATWMHIPLGGWPAGVWRWIYG